MSVISTAIDLTRVSRVVGYKVKNEQFNPSTPNLPQRIAVLGFALTANQATMQTTPFEFTSAKEVADEYGYGSMLHVIARILRPQSGDPLGGIPTVIYPQDEPDGAAAGTFSLGVTGTATKNVTHYLKINGRTSIDGVPYAVEISKDDDAATVIDAIVALVAGITDCPVTCADGETTADFTNKTLGLGCDVHVEVITNGDAAGLTYAESESAAGTGAPTLTRALGDFNETWNTIVINPWTDATVFATLEAFNGIPDKTNPTGRYVGDTFKPFIAFFGDRQTDKDDIVTLTGASARKTNVTNAMCPAPGSNALDCEAAANMAVLAAPIMQNTPHLGVSGKQYPDMPIPTDEDIVDLATYSNRDYVAKNGGSTAIITNGKFTIQDFITTYHPDGENPPKFRFVRDLNIDFVYGFKWRTIMLRDVQDKTLVPDNSPSRQQDTISPKQGKQLLISHIEDMAAGAMIADVQGAIESIQVGINETNPARLDFYNRYKRTSSVHIVSADAGVDFYYGN